MKRANYLISFLLIIIGIIGVAFTAKDFFDGDLVSGEALYVADQINAVVITSDVASVRVLPTTDNEIKVEWSENIRKTKEASVQIEEDKEKLVINIGKNRLFGSLNFSFGFNIKIPSIDVYLPEKQFELIHLETNVGSAEISAILTKSVIVKSDVAKIQLNDVVAKTIEATSSVGEIEVTNTTGELKAKSDVGKIDITTEEITGNMILNTEVGSISVTVPIIPDNVTFTGNSEVGSVNIFGEKGSYISGDMDYIVNMQTEVGSIKVTND